jgi:hypothetical protein
MDLLLWINTFRGTPRIPRLLRTPQGPQSLSRARDVTLWKRRSTRDLCLLQRPTPDVHLCSIGWLRDFISRSRIPRGSQRSRTQLLATKVRQRTNTNQQSWHEWTYHLGTHRGRSRSTDRIPIPSEGHLLVRSQPRRCERDLLLQARNTRSFRREREMVASQEGEWRYRNRTFELPDLIIRPLASGLGRNRDNTEWVEFYVISQCDTITFSFVSALPKETLPLLSPDEATPHHTTSL